MRLSDGMELDFEKTVGTLETQVSAAEPEFFAAVGDVFKESSVAIQEFSAVLNTELIVPLKKQYAETSGAPEKLFLDYIDAEIRKFNEKISTAKTYFLAAWGQTYGYTDFLTRYEHYFMQMNVIADINPVRRGISGQLHGIYARNVPLSGIVLIPIVVSVVKSAIMAKVWEKIIQAFMGITVVQELLSNILRTLIELWSAIYYLLRPDIKDRMNRVETRAKRLEKTAGHMSYGVNILITSIQSLQDNLAKRLDMYVGQLERIANPPEPDAPYVAPDTTGMTKDEIARMYATPGMTFKTGSAGRLVTNDPAARGVAPRYNIKGTPIVTTTGSSQSIKYEREYLADGDTEHIINIPALQHATRIYINKERFPI